MMRGRRGRRRIQFGANWFSYIRATDHLLTTEVSHLKVDSFFNSHPHEAPSYMTADRSSLVEASYLAVGLISKVFWGFGFMRDTCYENYIQILTQFDFVAAQGE
ncbi:hypothetical protein Tco_0429795 [Tanacetum coccineum]